MQFSDFPGFVEKSLACAAKSWRQEMARKLTLPFDATAKDRSGKRRLRPESPFEGVSDACFCLSGDFVDGWRLDGLVRSAGNLIGGFGATVVL
jgi:hypothetical protein